MSDETGTRDNPQEWPVPEPPDRDTSLLHALTELGKDFGPLGVAVAAASLTNVTTLIERLVGRLEPEPHPEPHVHWAPSPEMQAMADWLQNRYRPDHVEAVALPTLEQLDFGRPRAVLLTGESGAPLLFHADAIRGARRVNARGSGPLTELRVEGYAICPLVRETPRELYALLEGEQVPETATDEDEP